VPPRRWAPPNPFPRHALPDLLGRERALAQAWAAGPALIVIGHRDCATTRLTLPFVDRLHARRPPSTSVIAVLQDEPPAARELVADLGLTLPVLVEADPYPLAAELELRAAPTLLLVGTDGAIRKAAEGFARDALEEFSRALGVAEPLFSPGDTAPPRRPG
jgi:hypothetical protein